MQAQVKILRVIQDGEIEKIGRTEKLRVDVRVIAATNRNIEEEVKAKRFREDLYYRLNVLPIYVPELKNRKEDIPLLTDYFLSMFSVDMGKDKPVIPQETIEIMTNYNWQGNVRELKNVIQRFLFTDQSVITPAIAKRAIGIIDPISGIDSSDEYKFFTPNKIIPLKEMEKILREKYFKFVRENTSSDTEAAKQLGLAPPNYYRMCKELGLK